MTLEIESIQSNCNKGYYRQMFNILSEWLLVEKYFSFIIVRTSWIFMRLWWWCLRWPACLVGLL